MFGESVHASPSTDDQAVPELLAPSASFQKLLSVQENDRKHDAIPNKRRAHDEVRSTLSDVVSAAISLARNTAKDNLNPSRDRNNASQNAMRFHLVWSNLSQESPLQVQP